MTESGLRNDPSEQVTKPSQRVLERIAEADGVDPVELDPPLHDVVDATALDPCSNRRNVTALIVVEPSRFAIAGTT